jgi:hypothetical protein
MNDEARMTVPSHRFAVFAAALLLLAPSVHLTAQEVLSLAPPAHEDDAWAEYGAASTPSHPDWNHDRAGHPTTIAPWARLTYGPHYRGYYVGGGTPPTRMKFVPPADWRFLGEGTWGMDFAPDWSHVELLWTHGRRRQGGQGQYEPDRRNWPFGID